MTSPVPAPLLASHPLDAFGFSFPIYNSCVPLITNKQSMSVTLAVVKACTSTFKYEMDNKAKAK